MKSHLKPALDTFWAGCDRADGLCKIYSYIKKTSPAALNCDDILRSAVVLSVSSFDLLIHELVRLDIINRTISRKSIPGLKIPHDTLNVDSARQIHLIDQHLRSENAYKSFVSPDKLADCLRVLIDKPWDSIALHLPESPLFCKSRLKQIVALRNRIAHEADVNPQYGGVSLWPIYCEDVESAISYLRSLGGAVTKAVSDS